MVVEYPPADLFLTHLYAIVAGIERIQNIRTIVHNGLLPSLLGLTRIPHHDTLRDLLGKITPESFQSLQRAHDKIRAHLFGNIVPPAYSSVVDMDTTVLTVYGQQHNTTLPNAASILPGPTQKFNVRLRLFSLPSIGQKDFLPRSRRL